MAHSSFQYGKDSLTVGTLLSIMEGTTKGYLADEVLRKVAESAASVSKMALSDASVYGINTGFGPLCTTKISPEQTQALQKNILMSHSAGVGKPLSNTLVKSMLILKLHALALGYSGIQPKTLQRILWHVEKDILPVVPEQGSVGASGDLAPLAHLFLPLIGLGKVSVGGKTHDSGHFLAQQGLEPLELHAKEGLALINGTQFILAHAVEVVDRLHNCLAHADLLGAMTLDALKGSVKPFAAQLHALRPFRGTIHVAQRIEQLLLGSEINASHQDCNRVQDPYSLRCMPQVHGASRHAWLHLKELVNIELNAVTDNPVIFSENESISAGNFHGQPLAMPLDYAALAAAELGNISDRRIYLALEGKVEEVPTLLMHDTGVNSGFMVSQYTTAALVSENKSLCFPASADSIPTSLGQEDHVSMGSISGRKALQIIDNVEQILGIEMCCAAQAIDFHLPLKTSPILQACHALIRKEISFAVQDRVFSDDLANAKKLIQEKQLTQLAEHMLHQQHASAHHTLFETF